MNRFIQFNYHEQERPAVDEYENNETLSLEKVLEPLITTIEQLKFYLKQAKSLSINDTKYGLDKDQSSAIYLYTHDWNKHSLNHELNKALDSGDKVNIQPWLGFLKLFYSALEKLPVIKQTIYRRISKDIQVQLKDNSEIVCWQFVSCSTSKDIIENTGDQNYVVYSIEALSAKSIAEYTSTPHDFEALLLPGTRLRVKSETSLEEIGEVDDMETTSQEETNENSTTKPDDKTNKAVIIFENGSYYKATYVNGKKQGHGIYFDILNNDKPIENQEIDEKANGEGACTFKNGDCFVGTYEQGIRQGFGILYQKDGLIKIGEWANDELVEEKHSKPSSSGETYPWRDKDGKSHYYSIYYDDNGNRYLGNIHDDKAQGLGVRFWPDGSWYQGNFENDEKHGYGIYYDTNKGHYVGLWKNDEMHGYGKMIWKSKTKHVGYFENGKRHGQGVLTIVDKEPQKGEWQNDEYAGEK